MTNRMKGKKKKKTHITVRMNLLFLLVFVLFSVLVLRLGVVQIVKGDDYRREVERTVDVAVSYSVPRGKIYDRNGNIVVDNNPKNAITYTNYGASRKEMLEVAERLALLIDMDTSQVRERDKKDFWLLLYPEKGDKKVSAQEEKEIRNQHKGSQKDFDKAIYQLKLNRITDEDLSELTEHDLEVCAIYSKFASGYALTPQIVKNEGVTEEEFAAVSENLEYLPGVDTTTDWDRVYSYENTLRSILGQVSTTSEGLPRDNLDYYLSKGYKYNDRIGKSYIEAQYEDVLSGQKAKVKNITDKAGNVLETEVITEGQRGKDLVLTIDMDLQVAVEKIIEEELRAAKSLTGAAYLDRAFVVLMDPFTGEVLTMAGKQIQRDPETGKYVMRDFALGNISDAYPMGSAVKGATILTGLKKGAITADTYIHDTPVKIGNEIKRSHRAGLGTLNPVGALRVSSNVYMYHTVMRMANVNYYYGMKSLNVDPRVWEELRESFAQFGLGVETGIDLPNEQVGVKGTDYITYPGKLLDFSIGQYDTYTTIQLAQYISTIANGGYRIQPRLVKEIREPVLENGEIGPVFQEITPKILNKVDLRSEWLNLVKEGFRQVMHVQGGTGRGYFGGKNYLPAGKTGTAEDFYYQPGQSAVKVYNLTLVAYAPYDNPEVAMAVVVPKAYTGRTGNGINMKIGQRTLDTYFQLKKDRAAAEAQQNQSSNEEVGDGETDENAGTENNNENAGNETTGSSSEQSNSGAGGTENPEGRTEEDT